MATYNLSAVMRWAVASALRQTWRDFELIVVGDACTDDTEEVLAGFADPRIRFINLHRNSGEQTGPNNAGLAAARGELIAYLNHDDLWLPDHLESLTARLDARRADIVFSAPMSLDANGVYFPGLTGWDDCYDPSLFIPASLWLVRADRMREIDGWRMSGEIDASNPSQDVLWRAHRRTWKMVYEEKVTAILLPSGGRPNAYVDGTDEQHQRLFEEMEAPDFRDRLLTRTTYALMRQAEAPSRLIEQRRWHALVDRLVARAGLQPSAVRNRLSGRRRGWWIQHLRRHRGLPPSRGLPE